LFSDFGPVSTAFPPAPSRSLEILLMSEEDSWHPLPLGVDRQEKMVAREQAGGLSVAGLPVSPDVVGVQRWI
jgi:hypothetical protein